MDVDNVDELVLLEYTTAPAKSLLHSLKQTATDIGLHGNSNKTELICFNQDDAISSWNGKYMKLVDQLIYLSSNI